MELDLGGPAPPFLLLSPALFLLFGPALLSPAPWLSNPALLLLGPRLLHLCEQVTGINLMLTTQLAKHSVVAGGGRLP